MIAYHETYTVDYIFAFLMSLSFLKLESKGQLKVTEGFHFRMNYSFKKNKNKWYTQCSHWTIILTVLSFPIIQHFNISLDRKWARKRARETALLFNLTLWAPDMKIKSRLMSNEQ